MKYYYIKLFSFIFLLILAAGSGYAAGWQKAVMCADKKVQKKYYAQASEMYERILTKKCMHLPADSVNNVKVRLADCYMKMENTLKAESNYADVVKSGKADGMTIFNYARSLEANGKYDDAYTWFEKIAEDKSASGKKSKGFAEICEKAVKSNRKYGYSITRLPFNSNASEYAPAYYGKGLAFTSNRSQRGKQSNQIMWNKESFTDIYTVQEDNKGDMRVVDKLPAPINSRLNDGAAVFNAANDEVFFTRNNKHCKKHDQLQIYRSTYNGTMWSEPQLLSFEMAGASYAHPALSPDGSTLYFSSDMTGSGYGGMDLYMVHRSNNTWETAVNLGPTINTSGNETFPFVAADSSLYFTSDGWPGYGGMDIFHSKYENGKFEKPVNMGHDFNSPKDDLSLIVDSRNRSGYFASNRDGDDDIFSFRLPAPKTDDKEKKPVAAEPERSGQIVDRNTGTPVSGARVEVYKPNSTTAGDFYYTNDNGMFFYSRKIEPDDEVKVFKDHYKINEFKGMNVSDSKAFEISLEADVTPAPAKSNFITLYYDINKDNLTEHSLESLRPLVQVMKSHPKEVMYVSGYADQVGGDTYNLGLSLRRVKAVADYMSSEGIEMSRIHSSSFGAVKLTKECEAKPKCVTDTNRENRRVEIYTSNP